MNKNDAMALWTTLGKVAAGSILMGVGFVTALKGAMNCGILGTCLNMYDAAPEEYQKIADKMKKN